MGGETGFPFGLLCPPIYPQRTLFSRMHLLMHSVCVRWVVPSSRYDMQHRKRTRGTSTRKRGRTAAEPEPEPEPVAPSSLTISLSPPPPLVEEQQPQQQASCKRARVTSAELTAAAAASPCPAVCYPGFRQIPCPSMGCTLRVMPVDQIPASSAFHTARNYDLVPPKPKRLGCTIFSLPNQPRTCSVEVDLVELPGMTWMYAVPKSMNWPAFMRRLRLDRMLELSELPTPERPGQSAREMFLYRLRGWAIAAPAVLAPGIPLVPISEWSHSYLSDEAAAAAATPTATATAAATQEASACFSTTAADAAIRDTLSRVVDLKSLEPEYQLLEATQNICLLFSGRLFRPARLVGPEHVLQRSIYQCAAHSNRCLDTVRALMMDNTTDSPTLTPRDSSTVPTAVRIVQVGIYRGTPAEDCDVRYFAVPADAVQDLPAVQARSLTASDADVSSTASTSPHASPIKPSSARSASSSSSSSSTTSSPSLLSDGSNETGTLPDSDVDTHRARLFGSTESWQHSLSDLVWSVRKLGGCEVDPTEHVYCGRLRPICAEHHGEASATSITPNEAWPTYLPSVVIDLTKHRLSDSLSLTPSSVV